MSDPLTIARSIGDRFVAWQGTVGRPDPDKCPFVTTGRSFGPTHAHSPPYLAQALYRLYERTHDERYKEAADRYAVFMFSFVRDPVPPVADRQRNLRLSQRMERDPEQRRRSTDGKQPPSAAPGCRASVCGAMVNSASITRTRTASTPAPTRCSTTCSNTAPIAVTPTTSGIRLPIAKTHPLPTAPSPTT